MEGQFGITASAVGTIVLPESVSEPEEVEEDNG